MAIYNKIHYQFTLLFESKYNKKHPFRAVLRFVFWNICKYFKIDFHASVWGYKLKFWIKSHQSYWLYKNYIMDFDEFDFIKKVSRKGDVIIDIGANIGVYSFWFDKCISDEGRIFAFEPDKNNLIKFRYNMELNKETTAISIYDLAVSNKEGVIDFFSGLDEQSSISFQTNKAGMETCQVKTTTLDGFCKQENIEVVNFLKIDVEGAEYLVLEGAKELLTNKSIKVIQLELNNHINNYNLKVADVVKMMNEFNYSLYRLGEKLSPIKLNNYESLLEESGNNYFFLADISYVDNRLHNTSV